MYPVAALAIFPGGNGWSENHLKYIVPSQTFTFAKYVSQGAFVFLSVVSFFSLSLNQSEKGYPQHEPPSMEPQPLAGLPRATTSAGAQPAAMAWL